MTRTKGPMRWAGIFVALSAVFHIVALIAGGVSSGAQILTAAILYGVFAYGLINGIRWVAYAAFIVVFLGLSIAVAGVWSSGPIPGWVFGAISIANLATVACLFIALWRSAE